MKMNKKVIILAVLVMILGSAFFAWYNSPQKQLERADREMVEARTQEQLARADRKRMKAIKRGAKVEVSSELNMNDDVLRQLLGTKAVEF